MLREISAQCANCTLTHPSRPPTSAAQNSIQTRRGNLSCRSEGALRLVSKLGKLRLTAAEQLSLDSPAINLDAPSGLFIANGIKYLDGGTGDALGQRARDASEQRRDAEHPRAYNLLLADGRLVAAPA